MLARTFLQTTRIADSLFLVPDENVASLDRVALAAEQAAVSLALQRYAPQIRHVIVDLSSLSQLTSPLIETFLAISTANSGILRSFTLCHLGSNMSHALHQLQLLDAPHRLGNWREAHTRFAAFKARNDESSPRPGPRRISAASAAHRGDLSVFTIKQQWPIGDDHSIPSFRTKANLFQLLIQDSDEQWILIRQRTSPKSRSLVPRVYRHLSQETATSWLQRHRDAQISRLSAASAAPLLAANESPSSPLHHS